jgi:hypothetical protein
MTAPDCNVQVSFARLPLPAEHRRTRLFEDAQIPCSFKPPFPSHCKGGEGEGGVRQASLCVAGRMVPKFLQLVACLLPMFIASTGSGPLAADNAPTRHVIVTDSEGKSRSGLLTELGAGQVGLGHIENVRLTAKNLVIMKVKDRSASIAPTDPLVVLAEGDILVLRPEAIDDESLTARWVHFPTLPPVKLPLESVRGLVLNRPAIAAVGTRLLNRVSEFRETQDAVIMANGDTLTGEFTGLDEKLLSLQTPLGTSSIDRGGIRAMVFNPALSNHETLKGEGVFISLVDGSRFRARDLKYGTLDQLTLRTLFGTALELPLSAVESVRFLGGCATYLSDLSPASFKFEPYLDLAWPLRNDRNVSGGFLTLRGVEYARGLGVHSRSTVTYRLDGKYRRFHAVLGIDDETGGKGSVIFDVLVDGKRAFRSDILTGTSAPLVLDRLDISGAKLLTLRVDYATQGDIQDHADWCDAIVIK